MGFGHDPTDPAKIGSLDQAPPAMPSGSRATRTLAWADRMPHFDAGSSADTQNGVPGRKDAVPEATYEEEVRTPVFGCSSVVEGIVAGRSLRNGYVVRRCPRREHSGARHGVTGSKGTAAQIRAVQVVARSIARSHRPAAEREAFPRPDAVGGRAAISLAPPPRSLRDQIRSFAVIGAVSTLAYAALFTALRSFVPVAVANVVALGVTAIGNTAANRRLTFDVRDPRVPAP